MSAAPDVLLVEDDADLAAATRDYLSAFGLGVEHHVDAEAARDAVRHAPPGVILLDINLPGISGFDLCRELRAVTDAPIIFISARATDVDQVHGLSLGADDFIPKPFSLAVLLAKVRRALQRSAGAAGAQPPPPDFDDGRLRVELSTGRVFIAGRELRLTALEDRILRHLVTHRGSVCAKSEIIKAVWGDEYTSEGTLSVHIRRLRTRIEPSPESPDYIRTVWGRGYLFEAP